MKPDSPSTKDTISILFQSQDPPESSQRQGQGKPGRKRLPEGPRSPSGWRYRIKKDLLQKQGGRCAECQEKKELCLYRSRNSHGPLNWSDYVLLCQDCRTGKRREKEEKRKKRQEDQRKRRQDQLRTEVWTGSSANFFNQVRELIFQRDGAECPYCGSKENLQIGALIPLSRGGKLCFDNYSMTCQKCRGAKSGNQYIKPMTPLEFFWKREGFKDFLSESLDHAVTATPGATARLRLHFIGEIAEACARMIADDRVPPEHRKKLESIHIRLNESDEDRRRERQQLPW